mgnify:FL=1
MKNLTKALGIAGITALSFLPMKSEGQEVKKDSLRDDFKTFVIKNGKLDFSYGVPCYIYEAGSKDLKKSGYFHNAQIYFNKDKTKITELVMHFDFKEQISDSSYFTYNYSFYDRDFNGLNDIQENINLEENYEFYKTKFPITNPVLKSFAFGIISEEEVERIGSIEYPFSKLPKENRDEGREALSQAMKQIMHNAKYLGY